MQTHDVVQNNIMLEGVFGLLQVVKILGYEPPVKICVVSCGQTVTGSEMVTIDTLWELSNA